MCLLQTGQSLVDIICKRASDISRFTLCRLRLRNQRICLAHITEHFDVVLRRILLPLLRHLLAYQMGLVGERLVKSKLREVPLLLDRLLSRSHSGPVEACHALTVKLLVKISAGRLALLWSRQLHVARSC